MKHTYTETKNGVTVEVAFEYRTTDLKGYFNYLNGKDFKKVSLTSIGLWYACKMASHFSSQALNGREDEKVYEPFFTRLTRPGR